MSEAFVPINSKFQIGDQHSGEVFTDVAEVQKISGLGWSRDMIETTSLDTAGGYRTYLPSFRKGEVVTLETNFTAANWDRFRDIFETQASETDSWDFRVVLRAGAVTKYTWEFQAFVQACKVGDISSDGKVSLTIELQVTGAPVETSGA